MHGEIMRINYVNFTFHSVEGFFQNNSCIEINFTDITSYFQLQKHLPDDIFQAKIPGNVFINS
jgi:hypothetical protein